MSPRSASSALDHSSCHEWVRSKDLDGAREVLSEGANINSALTLRVMQVQGLHLREGASFREVPGPLLASAWEAALGLPLPGLPLHGFSFYPLAVAASFPETMKRDCESDHDTENTR